MIFTYIAIDQDQLSSFEKAIERASLLSHLKVVEIKPPTETTKLMIIKIEYLFDFSLFYLGETFGKILLENSTHE